MIVMAIKRSIDTGLWNDPLVLDEFSKDDKYFWLYCLTNPHNTLCGTAIISKKTMAREMGFDNDLATIDNLINKFENVYKRIKYNETNNEMIILNWFKYNWTTSTKVKTSLLKQVNDIKTQEFKNIILKLINNVLWAEKNDTV